MTRYNKTTAQAQPRSAVTSTGAGGLTHEGAPGWARTAQSELFLLAVAHMGDGSFYEDAGDRDRRFRDLIAVVATDSSGPAWLAGFIPWLRDTANMRTASVVAAAETARAFIDAGRPGARAVITNALLRADEPGEFLAYWVSRYGRALPQPVKRGLAGAADKLYSEYTLLKYDTPAHGYRFGDVIELSHAKGGGVLYQHAIDRRHGHGQEIPAALGMIAANAEIRKLAAEGAVGRLADPDALKAAGMTWEDALSLAAGRIDKAVLWGALIGSMGYMALLRNLRNFDQAQINAGHVAQVLARLTDPEQVARSRQFPFRFLAAYRAAELIWHPALETALNLSLANVPPLAGRTLILVDRSGSMFGRVSARSELTQADTAAVFGAALAVRAEHADLVEFGTGSRPVRFHRAESVLRIVDRFGDLGGTQTAQAVRAHYAGHDRLVIVTDEQVWGGWAGEDPTAFVPPQVPVYTWNLAGYRHGHGPSGGQGRHAFGGLTDAAFRMIPMLEANRDARWPWEA